uniref:Ig-like domain-containing protein n=1 Tax=Chelonoidis abingdonii TaxID=106734 RepID=A0A8C0QI22_CHEAB
MAPSTPVSGLSLPCLLARSLLPGAGAQEFQLLQPQGAVSVSAGETLTLTCSVTGLAPPGPLKWFKGSGSGRRLVYSDAGSFPRVTRAVSGSDTDFTIRISDTRSEDAGIYHCVKFKKGSSGADEEFRSGAGTTVSVSGAGAQEFRLLQPQGAVSVSAGETLTLTCSQTGLAPPGPVKWFKGSGSGRQLVYADEGSFPRLTRAVSGSDTDFTICISDTRPEDAGIYHCVKFRMVLGPDEEFRSGSGTAVSVSGECELPPAARPSPLGALATWVHKSCGLG